MNKDEWLRRTHSPGTDSGGSTPDSPALVPDGRPYSELVMRCVGEKLTAPESSDSDGIRRAWVELDSLDWHDDVCTPDCLTRRAHAQQLLNAGWPRRARRRRTETQLDQMAVKAWESLPQLTRQSLDQGDWREGFMQAARMLCDVVDEPVGEESP